MPTYKAEPKTEIGGNYGGESHPPLVFDAKGLLTVPDDMQEVFQTLANAEAAGTIKRVKGKN